MSDHRCFGGCGRPPVVIWRIWHNGAALPLCRYHLNIWLDNADDEPELEPDCLEFLAHV